MFLLGRIIYRYNHQFPLSTTSGEGLLRTSFIPPEKKHLWYFMAI